VSNWDSSKDPRKATLIDSWEYATSSGLVEPEGHPLEGFSTEHQYLLVEKKDGPEKPTYWGTTHRDLPSLRSYVSNSPHLSGIWKGTGWSVAYIFDLDDKFIVPTAQAFQTA
jgi:hypothetical protein